MAYDPIPSNFLAWGDPNNLFDYKSANAGQWFLGILDTDSKEVFILPSDLEPPDVYMEELVSHKGQYISKPQPPIPSAGWMSTPIKGMDIHGINSPKFFGDGVNGQAARDGLRQHGRVVRYNLIADNCLGFAIIKMGTGFGEFRDRSNSINYVKHKLGDNPRMSPSGRSVRMPEPWSNTLKEWIRVQIRNSATRVIYAVITLNKI